MKFFIAFSVALFASVHAIPAGIVNTGASAVSRSDDGHGNYAFGYNEDHATGGTFRKEKGGPGVQIGSYGLRDADGRVRTVNYVADALGFRASVDTNEPGVDPHQPAAATTLNGAAPVIPVPLIAPAPILAAPALAAAPLGYGGELLGKGYGGELLGAAPLAVGIPSAYSVATQHVAAPALGLGYGAPALGLAGPLGYGGEPALLGKGLGLAGPAGLGYGGPALGLGYGAGKLGGY